jgi:hypothetical protein
MKRVIPLLAIVFLGATGCIDRTRVNARCEWVPESADSFDLSGRQLERHLDRDIELATELAVRYADAAHKRRFGYEGHGGLIDGGRLRDGCMATLLSAIATTHHVSLDRVMAARASGRRPVAWDATVMLLFAIVYTYTSWVIARSISRRFPAEEGWPAVAAPVIASVGISAAGLQLFHLWAVTFEMARLGNDHLSGYRASWNPWEGHLVALYLGGILVFLVVAGLRYRLDKRVAAQHAV